MMWHGAPRVDTAIAFWFGSWGAMIWLALAAAAGMLSGVFRGTIWTRQKGL